MKISFLNERTEHENRFHDYLADAGIETVEPNGDCDFFWNASVLRYRNAHRISRQFPHVKTINYCWDFYKWAIENPRKWEYDWAGYAEYLKESEEVWVPNEGTKKRLKEMYDIDAHVIHTAITTYEHEVTDGRYVLNHLREYPEPNWGITEKWCKDNDVPYLWTDHGLSLDEWRKTVSNCRFMVCEYYEASTGGLTLLEGLWNGKPALVAKSPYQGGMEYLGEFGTYFQWDDRDDFARKMEQMWNDPPKIDIKKAREFITANYAPEVMAKKV